MLHAFTSHPRPWIPLVSCVLPTSCWITSRAKIIASSKIIKLSMQQWHASYIQNCASHNISIEFKFIHPFSSCSGQEVVLRRKKGRSSPDMHALRNELLGSNQREEFPGAVIRKQSTWAVYGSCYIRQSVIAKKKINMDHSNRSDDS
jgi:hypothetical protein